MLPIFCKEITRIMPRLIMTALFQSIAFSLLQQR